MEKEEFVKLFVWYGKESKISRKEDYSKILDAWEEYIKYIKDDLPIEKWIKTNNQNYLPRFLERDSKCFGSSRPGSSEQLMIYKYTGKDKDKQEKYYDGYNNGYFEEKHYDDVQKSFEDNIQGLLKDLVNATNLEEVYKLEKEEKYKKFIAQQILRKISVLMSLIDESKYKNQFMWVYSEQDLKKISAIFDIDYDDEKTYLENNKLIYDAVKEYAELTEQSELDNYIILNDLLWKIRKADIGDLSSFNDINIIYHGAPGTGKTYGVREGIKQLQTVYNDQFKEAKFIQFHPSFTYQDFIEGIKPIGFKDGNVDLEVVNGCFKEFCIYVKKENEKLYKERHKEKTQSDQKDTYPHYYFVVDEINRGDLSSILGETFTLLEKNYRDTDFSGNYEKVDSRCLVETALSRVIASVPNNDDLIYKKIGDKVLFGIPSNIHFIGLMNDVDRSIDAFDLALRRRFKWIKKCCDYDVIRDELEGYDEARINDYVKNCEKLNDYICFSKDGKGLKLGQSYEIGHAFFLKIKDIGKKKTISKAKKIDVFSSYIEGTLKEYIRQIADEDKVEELLEGAREAFGIQ